MGYFLAEQWIPVELARVFAFFSDPSNLPRIMPAELQARVLFIDLVQPVGPRPAGIAAGPGTTINFSFRPIPFLPIRQKWVAEILEYEYLSYFKDRQARGPFKSWMHIHSFKAETRDGRQGTVISDQVEFEIGYGVLGAAFDKLITARMRQTFTHRQAALMAALRPI